MKGGMAEGVGWLLLPGRGRFSEIRDFLSFPLRTLAHFQFSPGRH